MSLFFVNLILQGNISFINNTFSTGSALSLFYGAVFFIHGNAYFKNNTATNGGAMYLSGTTKLILAPAINISFIMNHADRFGGALYFEDSQCSLEPTIQMECFLSTCL